jgi:hypothetical protein
VHKNDDTLSEQLDQASRTKTAAVLIGTVVLAPVVSGVIEELSKGVASYFPK